MVRVVLFLVLVGLLALGVAWLADRPGEVAITWYGYRIETSVMVLAVALGVVIVSTMMLWSLLRAILSSPYLLSRFIRDRRGARGYQAISKGLIAVGSGDLRAARRHAAEARRIAGREPLALLLAAQTAQLAGDHAAADQAFRLLASRSDTKLLGLHGLYIEARRRGDVHTARACVEEAAALSPTPGWAGQAALDLRCAVGDWVGALDALERNYRSGLIEKATYRRHRAVLLTARAAAAEETERELAKPLALEAVRLAPGFVPAAALAGRLLAEAGELRKASRIIERAWREQPHPDLADAYIHLRSGDSARERLTRAQMLAARVPGHIESALAVARAAIDAREFAVARFALSPHLRAPTQRVALMMAELEQLEHGDEGRAREWMARAVHARRDPAWTADGIVSEQWLPVSPVTGRLDAFEWKVPLNEFPGTRPQAGAGEDLAVIAARAAPPPAPATEAPSSATAAVAGAEAAPRAEIPAPEAPTPAASPAAPAARAARLRAPAPANGQRGRPQRMVEALNPLVRAPDDPGVESPVEPAADRRRPPTA